MRSKLTTTEKLTYIDEVKESILNAFRGSSGELDSVLDEVSEKLKNFPKLNEMSSKKNIEQTFVSHLAMSLASRIVYHQEDPDLVSILSRTKPVDK